MRERRAVDPRPARDVRRGLRRGAGPRRKPAVAPSARRGAARDQYRRRLPSRHHDGMPPRAVSPAAHRQSSQPCQIWPGAARNAARPAGAYDDDPHMDRRSCLTTRADLAGHPGAATTPRPSAGTPRSSRHAGRARAGSRSSWPRRMPGTTRGAPSPGGPACSSPAGSTRAALMNAGAAAAGGEILWFLHADSLPPRDAVALITGALADPRVVSGAFAHRFSEASWSLAAINAINRVRYRLTRNYYGDQGHLRARLDLSRPGRLPRPRPHGGPDPEPAAQAARAHRADRHPALHVGAPLPRARPVADVRLHRVAALPAHARGSTPSATRPAGAAPRTGRPGTPWPAATGREPAAHRGSTTAPRESIE